VAGPQNYLIPCQVNITLLTVLLSSWNRIPTKFDSLELSSWLWQVKDSFLLCVWLKRKEFEIIEGNKKKCRFYLYPNIWKWYKTLSYTIRLSVTIKEYKEIPFSQRWHSLLEVAHHSRHKMLGRAPKMSWALWWRLEGVWKLIAPWCKI